MITAEGPPSTCDNSRGRSIGPPFTYDNSRGRYIGPPFTCDNSRGRYIGPPFTCDNSRGRSIGPPFTCDNSKGRHIGPPFTCDKRKMALYRRLSPRFTCITAIQVELQVRGLLKNFAPCADVHAVDRLSARVRTPWTQHRL